MGYGPLSLVANVKKPNFSTDALKSMINRLYGVDASTIKQLNGYYDQNCHVEITNDDSNLCNWKHGYVLKIINEEESNNQEFFDGLRQLAIHLEKHGFQCPQVVINMRGEPFATEVYEDELHGTCPESHHLVYMQTFIPGTIIYDVPYTPSLLFSLGKYVANMSKALTTFENRALEKKECMWNMKTTPSLKFFLWSVTDVTQRKLVEDVIDDFEELVVPQYHKLRKGVVHGDITDQNILVRKPPKKDGCHNDDEEYKIVAVIDLGDACGSFYIHEVAVAIMTMMEAKTMDPLHVGGHILAGYFSEDTLNQTEWDILKLCVEARWAQSLIIGAYTYSLRKDPYTLLTAKVGWSILERMRGIRKEELYELWQNIIDSYSKSI